MATVTEFALDLSEHNLLPDVVIRYGIKRLLKERLKRLAVDGCERQNEYIMLEVQSEEDMRMRFMFFDACRYQHSATEFWVNSCLQRSGAY